MPKVDHSQAFLHYKSALQSVIESAFGWNEDFQIERFKTKYEPHWFYWVEIDLQRVGYVCFYETNSKVHVSLLIIFEEFRKKSYGQIVMQTLQQRALNKSLKVTLSTFKSNTGAINFYKNMGYEITNEDDFFYDMSLTLK